MMALTTSYATMVKKGRSDILSQLFELVRDGKSSELNECLNDRPYTCSLLTSMWTRASEKEYLSLLMIAALHGHEMVVREILLHSPNIEKMVELKGRMHSVNGDLVNNVTALWCALDRAHFSVARTLIDVGKANINHGPVHPILLDAVIRGRLDIVHFLIENGYAGVNETKTNDENKCNSLIASVLYGHTSIAEYLIKKNAELESKTDVDGNTALAIAVIKGNLELVRILGMAGASSTVRNHADKTPIKLAAENNQLDVVSFLIEHTHDDAVFNDLELAVASHILAYKGTPNYKSEWALELLRYLLLKRIQFNIPKSISEPAALYDFQQECQTIDELDHIQEDDDRLYVEALLIEERVLLAEKDEISLTWLFDRAMILVEKGAFDHCLDLVMHIFRLSQRSKSQPSLKQYFWIFYNMFKSKVPIPVDRFWETCDLIFKSLQPNSNDSHIRDISYLLELGTKVRHSSRRFPSSRTMFHRQQ
jgi:ankyrin repeat protein